MHNVHYKTVVQEPAMHGESPKDVEVRGIHGYFKASFQLDTHYWKEKPRLRHWRARDASESQDNQENGHLAVRNWHTAQADQDVKGEWWYPYIFTIEFGDGYQGPTELKGTKTVVRIMPREEDADNEHKNGDVDFLQRLYCLHSLEGVTVNSIPHWVDLPTIPELRASDCFAELPGATRQFHKAWMHFEAERIAEKKFAVVDSVFGCGKWQNLTMACTYMLASDREPHSVRIIDMIVLQKEKEAQKSKSTKTGTNQQEAQAQKPESAKLNAKPSVWEVFRGPG